ncbi:MAG: biotin/lipoyl-binding protein [Bacteriovoracaceae bacterium]|nr:biotin/lipoyl-binding protein [Bacteriovoracaceae bacterium]
MRTYLIDSENNELKIDLTRTIIHSSKLVEFEFSTVQNNEVMNTEKIYIKKLAGSYFSSVDSISWEKMARQHLPVKMLNIDRVFDVYYGYKPSGLNSSAEGELFTKMSGKITKINVKEGDVVVIGQTLLILEAMKMENEIKSSLDGVVKAVHVSEGDVLEENILMMEVE